MTYFLPQGVWAWALVGGLVWAAGALLVVAFMAGATRKATPAPCDHPAERQMLLGETQVCGVCGAVSMAPSAAELTDHELALAEARLANLLAAAREREEV